TDLVFPVMMYGLVTWLVPLPPGMAGQGALALMLLPPLGPYLYRPVVPRLAPYLYRLAFQPLEQASVLTLLIASVGVYIALTVLGLVFFGPEGFMANPLSGIQFDAAGVAVSGQSVIMVTVSLVLMLVLWLLFDRTLIGKAM